MTHHVLIRPRAAVARKLGSVRHWRQTELGQSLVEFTMVLPIFLILLFGLVDFGRAFYTWMLVTNAAREGARTMAVQADAATVDSNIRSSLCSNYPSNCSLDTTKMTVVKTPDLGNGSRGSEASVDITYAFSYVTPIGPLISLFGGSLATPSITAHSSMRFE